jgi:tripartite-type tricarboxylate transporter receptor subunit TctC
MITRRRLIEVSATSMLAATLGAPSALAQSWPTRPVHIIVPYAPGGPTDVITRLVADKLTKIWGQQIVVENRGGAGTNIASELVARSEPDGYTILVNSPSLAINRILYRTLNYDPVNDFAPVTMLCRFPMFMFVPNSSPAKSVKEFIALAKSSKERMTFASPGIGTTPHLAAELFKRTAGIALTHVPYRGAAPAMNDLIPGRVSVLFSGGASLQNAKQGQVRVIGVTGAKRAPEAPEVPTIAESALPGFEVVSWFALFVPAKTSPAIIKKLNADVAAVLADAAVKARLEHLSYEVHSSSPDELGATFKAEMAKWAPVIKEGGLTLGQ